MSLAEAFLWRAQAPLRRVLGRLNRIDIGECPVPIGDDVLYASSVDRWLAAWAWKTGLLGRSERRLIAREVGAGMVALDLGANLGLHTLALARLVGPAGRVWAIEPDPDCFRALARARDRQKLGFVRLVEAAAGARAGTATLYRSHASRGENGLYPLGHDSHTCVVHVVALDALLAEERAVDFVKIDVQGAELAALAGMSRTLDRSPEVRVLCELCPAALGRAGAEPEELFERLADRGLRANRLLGDGRYAPITAAAAIAAARAAGSINLYFRRT